MARKSQSAVRIDRDTLVMGPVRITFQRTLRIPEQGLHPLPPGLGAFPLRRVEDYPDTAPAAWLERGGVMLPIYQREAMWLNFLAEEPAALQVGVGGVCAVSGEAWATRLRKRPQNYVALPDQPWLDGINAGDGFVRQFVAVPLGLGATVEGQVTGEEKEGGVQLRCVGLDAESLLAWREQRYGGYGRDFGDVLCCSAPDPSMGLGAGGRMRQEVYADDRRLRSYDSSRSWSTTVHLCSAAQWTAITGEIPPSTPVDRDQYVRAGLPWFDYYDADTTDLPPAEGLARVKSVGTVLKTDDEPFPPVKPESVVILKA